MVNESGEGGNTMIENPAKTKQMRIVEAVKDMLDAGYDREDIMEALHLSEATFRSYLRMINEDKEHKLKRNGSR